MEWRGRGRGTLERETQRPQAVAHILAPGRRSSLPSLPTLISQWSPHISAPAVSLTGEGAALAAWREGARLPDLHSHLEAPGTFTRPLPGEEHRAPTALLGELSPASLLLPTSQPPHRSQSGP